MVIITINIWNNYITNACVAVWVSSISLLSPSLLVYCFSFFFRSCLKKKIDYNDYIDRIVIMISSVKLSFINSPSFHSLVEGLIYPNSSSVVTAFGFKSKHVGFFFMLCIVLKSVRQTCVLPVPACPMMNTLCRTSSSSFSWITCQNTTGDKPEKSVLFINTHTLSLEALSNMLFFDLTYFHFNAGNFSSDHSWIGKYCQSR